MKRCDCKCCRENDPRRNGPVDVSKPSTDTEITNIEALVIMALCIVPIGSFIVYCIYDSMNN